MNEPKVHFYTFKPKCLTNTGMLSINVHVEPGHGNMNIIAKPNNT